MRAATSIFLARPVSTSHCDLGHEGVIGTWRAARQEVPAGCWRHAGNVGHRSTPRKLVKPLRDGGAIGRIVEPVKISAAIFPSEFCLCALKTFKERQEKRKFLRFMREAVRRRLTVERPQLLTPLPPLSCRRLGVPIAGVFNGEPKSKGQPQHRSRGLGIGFTLEI